MTNPLWEAAKQPPQRPPAIQSLFDALIQVECLWGLFADTYREAVERHAGGRGPLRSDWPEMAGHRRRQEEVWHAEEREAARQRGENPDEIVLCDTRTRWAELLEELARAYVLWCGAALAAIEAVRPACAARAEGDPTLHEQWFIDLRCTLRQLSGGLGPYTYGEDGLGLVRMGCPPLPERAHELADEIAGKRLVLMDVVACPAACSEPAQSGIVGKTAREPPPFLFRRRGEIWEVAYEGVSAPLKHMNGLGIIAFLLARPNPAGPIPALELAGSDARLNLATHTPQEVLSAEAKEKLRLRLTDLEAALGPDRGCYGADEIAAFESEQQRILSTLKEATGLHGKDRHLGPPSLAEQARKNVHLALERAYTKLATTDPPHTRLVQHLRASIKAAGTAYAYRPGPSPPDWDL